MTPRLLQFVTIGIDEPVQAGRDAFGSGWQYPWYDSATDDVRRVKTRGTWDWPEATWSAGNWQFDWIQFVFWIFIALLLGILAYFLIRAYLNREDRLVLSEAEEAKVNEIGDAERIAALPFNVKQGTDLLEEARRHYQAGRHGQAIVYLFSHELVELDKRQRIRLTKGKTNRQYLREIGSAGALRTLLEQTMVAFEEVFFGGRPLDRARFESCWNRLDEFDRLTAGVQP